MALGAIRAGKAFVEVYADGTRLAIDFKKIGNQFKAFGAGISAIGLKIMGVGTAITSPFAAAIKHFMDAGSALDDMAQRTGVSTNALSELGYAALMSGTNIEAVEKAIMRMQKSKGTSGGKGTEALFMGELDRLAAMPDATRRAAEAMKIFGKSGTALIPMVGNFRMLRQEAIELGLSIGPEQAKRAAEMGDAWDRLKRSTMAAFFNIGSAVADSGILDATTKIIVQAGKWVKANGDILRTVAKVGAGLVAGGAAMFAFGKAISFVGVAIDGVFATFAFAKGVVAFFGAAFSIMFNPITLVVIALAGVAAGIMYLTKTTIPIKQVGNAIWDYLGKIREGFRTLVEDASKAWQGISDALIAGKLDLAWKVVTTSLQLEWARLKKYIMETFEPVRRWWVDVSFGLSSIFVDALSTLKSGWAEALGFLQKAWNIWITGLQVEEIARLLSPIIALLEGVSVASINEEITKLFNERRASLGKKNLGVDAGTRSRQAAIEQDRQAMQDILAARLAEKKRGHLDEVRQRELELEAAIRERDAAIQSAQRAAYKTKQQLAINKPSLSFAIDAKSLTTGTFSGQELAGTGGRSPALLELKAHTALFKKFIVVGAETSLAIKNLNLELAK